MDIVSALSNSSYNSKLLTVTFNFNKVGFLIDMIERLNEIVTPDSCPRITFEYFIMSIFLPCVKKTLIGKPMISELFIKGGKKGKKTKKIYSKNKRKNKNKNKTKHKKKYTRKIKGGTRIQWQIVISFFFLLMSLLNSSLGQLQLENESEYKIWKRNLIETRGEDTAVLKNYLGICSIDAYAVAGFFPIAEYKRVVELQLGVVAYDFNKFHPQGDIIPMREIQRLEVEEAVNINIDAYRIKIPNNTIIDAYKLYELLIEGFSSRFINITPGSFIIGTFGYSVVGGGGHSANIIYTKTNGGDSLIEIVDLSSDEIITEELNPLQAIEYIKKNIKPNERIDIYFSKQQSLKNIPESFKNNINMEEIEESVGALSPFSELLTSDEIINNAYRDLQQELISNNDTGDRVFIKRKINNFLIKTYGSLEKAYPNLQGPLPKSIKTNYNEPLPIVYF